MWALLTPSSFRWNDGTAASTMAQLRRASAQYRCTRQVRGHHGGSCVARHRFFAAILTRSDSAVGHSSDSAMCVLPCRSSTCRHLIACADGTMTDDEMKKLPIPDVRYTLLTLRLACSRRPHSYRTMAAYSSSGSPEERWMLAETV